MRSWKTSRVGDLIDRAATWNPSRSPTDVFDYIDLSAVDQDTKAIVDAREIRGSEAPSRARQLVKKGDVLVSTVRPNLNGVARVLGYLDGATASTGFCVLRPRPDLLDGGYLFHWVKTPRFRIDMVRKATGASYPAVSDRIVQDSTIPLPPLEEQRRIADVLDRAEELRAKRRAALAQLETLTQSIFLDLFGDPTRNPKGWIKGELGDFAAFYGGGTPSRARPDYFDGTICWATSKDMKSEFLDDTEEHITEQAIEDSATKLVPVGTILIVVKSKILAHHLPVAVARVPTCFGQDLKGIRLGDECETAFVVAALRIGKRWLLERARGINTEGLTLNHLRAFPIPLPPIGLQREFAHRTAAVETLKNAHRASLSELETLFASLQHRAFRGEL